MDYVKKVKKIKDRRKVKGYIPITIHVKRLEGYEKSLLPLSSTKVRVVINFIHKKNLKSLILGDIMYFNRSYYYDNDNYRYGILELYGYEILVKTTYISHDDIKVICIEKKGIKLWIQKQIRKKRRFIQDMDKP